MKGAVCLCLWQTFRERERERERERDSAGVDVGYLLHGANYLISPPCHFVSIVIVYYHILFRLTNHIHKLKRKIGGTHFEVFRI